MAVEGILNAWIQANRGSKSQGTYFGEKARQAFEWWEDEVDTSNVRFVGRSLVWTTDTGRRFIRANFTIVITSFVF